MGFQIVMIGECHSGWILEQRRNGRGWGFYDDFGVPGRGLAVFVAIDRLKGDIAHLGGGQ